MPTTKHLTLLIALLAVSLPIVAQEPDDRYVTLIGGNPLIEGRGFPGLFEVGDSSGTAGKILDRGHPDAKNPLWQVYDKGTRMLTLCVNQIEGGPLSFGIHAIIVEGAAAPKTDKGIGAGDSVADPEIDTPRPDEQGDELSFRVPAPPKLASLMGEGFVIFLPDAWPAEESVWRQAGSPDLLAVIASEGTANDPEDVLATGVTATLNTTGIEGPIRDNRITEDRCVRPPEFRSLLQADAARAFQSDALAAGRGGGHLAVSAIMASKGGRRVLVIVTRSQHPQRIARGAGFMSTTFMGSPDGLALASGVMRSLRIP